MTILRDVARALVTMFVADASLAAGILIVVFLTGLLTGSGTVAPLWGGALLLLGCIVVLVTSVVLAARRHHDRR